VCAQNASHLIKPSSIHRTNRQRSTGKRVDDKLLLNEIYAEQMEIGWHTDFLRSMTSHRAQSPGICFLPWTLADDDEKRRQKQPTSNPPLDIRCPSLAGPSFHLVLSLGGKKPIRCQLRQLPSSQVVVSCWLKQWIWVWDKRCFKYLKLVSIHYSRTN